MFITAIALIVIFAAYIFRNYWWRLIKTKWYGIEAEALVSRIEGYTSYADGAEYPRRFYYVSFQTQSGLQNEAKLLNPKGPLCIGSKIRIKYLDERADYAVLTEIIKT